MSTFAPEMAATSGRTSARRPGQPLLTVAVPTYNRASFLAELLETLLPQFSGLGADAAELLISDNCSEDETQATVESFRARGLPYRYLRNAQNIGADGNFLQCVEQARGQYVWVLGDDDLLVPGAIPDLLSLLEQQEVDLVYLSSFSFAGQVDLAAARRDSADKLGRFAEIVTDGSYFLEKANALIGLISVMLINKNRLEITPHPPVDGLHNSNLMQVGWLFPLLGRRTSVLYLWQRLVAYRSYNSGGWGVCQVFGVRLQRLANEYFAQEPELAQALMNGVLRYWLCDAILEIRRGRHSEMHAEDFDAEIRHLFAGNWRYWVFVWPMAELPMPLASLIHRLLAAVNKLTRVGQGLWRHLFRHGRYLYPARPGRA